MRRHLERRHVERAHHHLLGGTDAHRRAFQDLARPAPRLGHQLRVRHHRGDEAEPVALLRADAAPGEHHAHRLLQGHHARQALQPARARREADARLGQREQRLVRGDDQVAGERDLETTTHRKAIHRRDHRLGEVIAVGEPGKALRRMLRALAGLRALLGVILQVVAGAERLVAGAGDDRDPQFRVGGERIEGVRQLLVGHRVQRVVHLGPVDGDGHQVTVALDPAVLAHCLSSGSRAGTAGRMLRRASARRRSGGACGGAGRGSR